MRSSAPDPWIDRVCDAMREHERERPRYERLEEIGRGGMAVVYRAVDRKLNREVALKVLREDFDPQPEDRARFRREAEAAARLSHPNVVTLLDAGEEEGRLYLAMEIVQGRPLHLILERERPSLDLLEKVACGVQHAHRHGIVHRDLKPSNILVTESGEPKVSDFGIAHLVDATRLTKSDALLGTPLYMAPEQVRGEAVTPQTDVYALGAILYEMTTGRPPHQGATAVEIFRGILDDEPVPPRHIDPKIPVEVETICLKALEKSPVRRYPTAQAFAEDLRRVREGRSIEARPTSRLTRWWRKARRHRAILLPIAALLLAATGMGAWLGVSAVRRSRQIQQGLGSARLLESEERYSEAREVLLGVLKLDLRNAEARRGLERLEQKTAEIERRKEAARVWIEKDRKAEAVLTRWIQHRGKLRQVEALYYDSTLTPDERRQKSSTIWDADVMRRFAGETPHDPVSMATVVPLQGWAIRLSLDEKSGLQMIRSGAQYDPEVPYGFILEAFVLLDRYVEDLLWPGPIDPPPAWNPSAEGPDARAVLRELPPLLEKAKAAKVWGEEIGKDFKLALAVLETLVAAEPAAAEEALSRAIASDRIDLFRRTFLLLRAKMRTVLQRFEEAERDLREAAEVLSGYATIHGLRGVLQSAQARSEEAVRSFGAALAHDPKSAATYLGRGNAQGPGEKAIDDYVEAMKIDPGLTLSCHNRGSIPLSGPSEFVGRLYLAWGRIREEREPYSRAIASFQKIEAKRPEVLRWMGEAYLGLGEIEAAIESFGRADDRASRGWAHARLAASQETRGADPSAAYAKALEDFGAVTPATASLLHLRAKTHYQKGRGMASRGLDPEEPYNDALRDLREALKLDPSILDLRRTRAAIYFDWCRRFEANDIAYSLCEEAIADLTAVLERPPQSEGDYLLRGKAYLRLSACPKSLKRLWWEPPMKARADFESALRCNPESIEARFQGGLADCRTAELQEDHGLKGGGTYYESAIRHFDEVLSRDPQRWDAYAFQGRAYECLGRWTNAVACYRKSLDLHPDQPQIRAALDRAAARSKSP